MNNTPDRSDFRKKEWQLIERLNTPVLVQRFFSSMPYNWERQGATMRSFREVIRRNQAHCLEAAVGAAVILEQHGYPPLLLDLESQDKLDHVMFVFQQNGRWGSVARSRDIGLHGRRAVFRSLRDLVWSYFDPYVDRTGRIVGYGLADLHELGNYDWRFSSRDMHKIEDYLREMPHKRFLSSDKRYQRLWKKYQQFKEKNPDQPADYYRNRNRWML